MRVLLTAINSKYIHSNLAVYSLKAYHDVHSNGICDVELAEYTINQYTDEYIADIYMKKPDIIAFSCYIWNIKYVFEVTVELKKIMPELKIWLGGPEVTFDSEQVLKSHPEIDGVMCGEGEETFSGLCNCGFSAASSDDISGIVYRHGEEIITTQRLSSNSGMNMDDLPFVYEDLSKFENKIIYYESSRGCPFGCSYCLSSVDKNVRFRSLPIVFKELKHFLDNKVSQVKFVDRTFNCSHDRTVELLKFIRDNDNGITNFHFEIAADLLKDDEIAILNSLRPGLVQLEIGVQSTNIDTIRDINRKMDFSQISSVVNALNMGENVHLHLDLIAGLPNEDIESFHKSFNDVYRLSPEQLQLGFLKVLKGSPIELKAEEYGIVRKSQPPYEVISTKWMTYGDILHLKQIEEMVEVYYNSRQYVYTMRALSEYYRDAYVLFESLAAFYDNNEYFGIKHSRISRYEILYKFICTFAESEHNRLREILIYDLYLRENLKTRPYFAESVDLYKKQIHELCGICNAPKSAHLERFSRDFAENFKKLIKQPCEIYAQYTETQYNYTWVLFDYQLRDPLNYNGRVRQIKNLL